MEIKELEFRMYFLAGQLEESKKIYRDALGEMERMERANKEAQKEQANRKTETITSPSDSKVSIGEPAAV